LDSKLDLRAFLNPEFFGKSFHGRGGIGDSYSIKKLSVADILCFNPNLTGLISPQ